MREGFVAFSDVGAIPVSARCGIGYWVGGMRLKAPECRNDSLDWCNRNHEFFDVQIYEGERALQDGFDLRRGGS